MRHEISRRKLVEADAQAAKVELERERQKLLEVDEERQRMEASSRARFVRHHNECSLTDAPA
jgi:hypothetical protein